MKRLALSLLFVLSYHVGVNKSSKVVTDDEYTSDKKTSAKLGDVRLPRHLVPLKYKLELVPFIIPDNFTIRGFAQVGLEWNILNMGPVSYL